jgi:hypothetical protein
MNSRSNSLPYTMRLGTGQRVTVDLSDSNFYGCSDATTADLAGLVVGDRNQERW